MKSNTVLSTTDSLILTNPKSEKIQLIVNDGCEALGDTALFNIIVKPPLKAITNLKDTSICASQIVNFTATAQGGDSKAYHYQWLLNNKLYDTTNALSPKTDDLNLKSTLSLILSDNCSANDTITKTITVKPSPKSDFIYDLACSHTMTKFQFTGTKPASPVTTNFIWNYNNEGASTL